ncbi:fumarylacetoacetate hydrolase family protein [Polycladidibacter stylochi]|uniref:fumarylacetoacetate hydrolase family protein n=1 Tax=Polycladidibacter stylochi TaxID=1807766 RepID=UPI0008340F96|nr:fumarylacetoacetate hydrolase family protein [Pseudovibrio stylochi]
MQEIAQQLMAARNADKRIAPEDYPAHILSNEDALAVQRTSAKEYGAIGAWKIAKDGEGTPLFAPIFTRDICRSGADFSEGKGIAYGVEIEVAFELTKDLKVLPLSDDALWEAIGKVYMVIELVRHRLAEPSKAKGALNLADNMGNAGFVIGDEIPKYDRSKLGEAVLKLDINGESIIDGPARNGLGDPVALLKNALKGIGEHCGGFKAGQIITTGSFSGCTYYPVGSQVKASFPELGSEVAVTL